MSFVNKEQLLGFYSNQKSWLTPVLIGAVCLGGGYGFGRYAQPEKVLITEKIKEVEKLVVVEKIKTEVQIVKVFIKDTSQQVHRTVTEEKRADGSSTTTTREDTATETKEKENSNSTEVKYVDRIVEKVVIKEVEKLKLVESKKLSWILGGGVGVSIPHYLGQASPGVPGLNGVVIQAEINRRVVGPFFLGLSGNTQGVLGLNLIGAF